jgi:chromosome partitioning protein
VIIQIQASPPDAELAARAIHLIREEEQAFEKTIPYRVLFTRTSPAIASRETQITAQLKASEVPMFRNHLNERSAYKAMFFYQQDLDELDPKNVNGLPAARDNAFRLAEELVNLIIDARVAA